MSYSSSNHVLPPLFPCLDDSMVLCSHNLTQRFRHIHQLELQRIQAERKRETRRQRRRRRRNLQHRQSTNDNLILFQFAEEEKPPQQQNDNNTMLSSICTAPANNNKQNQRPLSPAAVKCNNNNRHAPIIIDPYQLLQIRRDATRSEIRQAYRRWALLYHPNRSSCIVASNTGTNEGERRQRQQVFAMVAAAYETLVDAASRNRLDALLRETSHLVSQPNIPVGQIVVGRNETFQSSHHHPGQQQQQQQRRRLHSHDNSIIRHSPSLIDGDDDANNDDQAEPVGKSANQTPSLAEVSLTDSSEDGDNDEEEEEECFEQELENSNANDNKHDDDNDDDTDQHDNLHVLTPSEEAGFTLLSQLSSSPMEKISTPTCLVGGGARSCRSFVFGCVRGGSSYDDPALLPALVNHSSSTTADFMPTSPVGGEKHYTETDTDRLFGGPLQLLYRARRWKPFTDPMLVYQSAFGSQLMGKSSATTTSTAITSATTTTNNNNNNNNPSLPWQALLERSNASSEPWTRGTIERQADGSLVLTKIRIFQNKRMIRRETVWTDRSTGHRHSVVSVTSEPLHEAKDRALTTVPPRDGFCVCFGGWGDDKVVPATATTTTTTTALCTLETILCGDMLCGDNTWFCADGDPEC